MCPNKNSLPSEFLITTEYWLCQGRFLLLVMINNALVSYEYTLKDFLKSFSLTSLKEAMSLW